MVRVVCVVQVGSVVQVVKVFFPLRLRWSGWSTWMICVQKIYVLRYMF